MSRHGQPGSPAAAAAAQASVPGYDYEHTASTESNTYDPTPPTIPAPNSTIIELPILELDDVILFPGCTVPLRLRHPGWVEYLGRRIDEARFGFGAGFGAGGDTSSSNPVQQQVRIGVMMRLRETRRRTRRRRPREAPAAAVEGDVIGHGAGRARQGRWRMESLRRGVVRRREPEQEEQERATDSNDTEDGDEAHSNTERPRRQRDNDSGPSSFVRPRQPEDPRIGRIGTVAIITYTHEVAAEGESAAITDEVTDNGGGADSPSYRSRVWLRHSGQLVMTAMGTARFKILSRIDTGSTTLDAEQRVYPEMFRGDMADIKLYAVELLVDENLPLPPIRPLLRSSLSTISEDGAEESSHCDMIEMLSRITPMPSFAYNAHWPWKLVQEICKELSEIPVWEGLWKSLPPSSGHKDLTTNEDFAFMSNQANPLAFAFWMASNMSLSLSDRLDMLEMDCNLERLRLILVKVAQQRQLERPIRCKQCGERITTISSLFTIDGAEGTTGAYVNQYGIVHQTQTVRTVDADHVFCVGNRESRDSWFNGYTWTIMHCATCAAHLGWKFDAIRGQGPTESTEDRPKRFFGLTGGAITTEESSAPRRVGGGPGSVGLADRLMMDVVRLQAIQGMAAEDDRADASDSENSTADEADDDEDGADEEEGSD